MVVRTFEENLVVPDLRYWDLANFEIARLPGSVPILVSARIRAEHVRSSLHGSTTRSSFQRHSSSNPCSMVRARAGEVRKGRSSEHTPHPRLIYTSSRPSAACRDATISAYQKAGERQSAAREHCGLVHAATFCSGPDIPELHASSVIKLRKNRWC